MGFLKFVGFLIVVVLALVVLFGIMLVSVGNGLARKSVKIDEALSGIEVALVKRYDTLTKMADVAKAYARYELETLTKIISLRRGMTVPELTDSANKMNDLEAKINLTAEAYPELRSNTVFTELQKGIRDTEEHLQAARRLYNANVSSFNQDLAVFPKNIIASVKGYTKRPFFEATEAQQKDVKMDF